MDKLSKAQIEQFIASGYVKVENAFSQDIADSCCSILWEAIEPDPGKPETWTRPVIWIGELGFEPFKKAANTPVLINAFHQLAGDNWLPRATLGSFPVRFPSNEMTHDTGWHVDASFPGDDPNNYLEWKINVNSKGRALLMLFLFSNVSAQDAPTRIKEGSHLDVAKLLEPVGAEGLTFMQLAAKLNYLPTRKEVAATGNAGSVYLCHPFLVHAAQQHRGNTPRFMAQPPLLSKKDFNILQPVELGCPVEQAIIRGINSAVVTTDQS